MNVRAEPLPRVEPAAPPFDPDVQAAFDRLPRDWMPPFRLFTTLARDPRLLRRFMRGAPIYFPESNLTVRQREVLLTRVTALCNCPYEWRMRVHYFAQAAGLTAAQIEASVRGGADDACWNATDRLLIRLADALHADCDIADDLWRELRAAFSETALLELLLLAGYYRTVAYLANGLRLPPEPGISHPFPAAPSAPAADAADNKRRLQRIFAELAQGNGRALVDALADDASWTIIGSTAWSKTYRGKPAVRTELLEPLRRQLSSPNRVAALRFIAEDDWVVVEARGDAVTRTGMPYRNSYCWTIRFADGRIAELTEYMDTALVAAVLDDPA